MATHYNGSMEAFIYILKCADGSYYTGSARGETLDRCIAEHQTGHYGGYTASRRPVMLVYRQYFDRIDQAIAAERQVKGWSRAKKQAPISGNFDTLPVLARSRNRDSHQNSTDVTSPNLILSLSKDSPARRLRHATILRQAQDEDDKV